MSTTTVTKSRKPASDRSWIPSSLYRLTLDQYEAMVDSGIFTWREKVQLNNGYLVAKMTQNTPHATADDLCGDLVDRQVEVYSNLGPSGYQSLEVFVPPHVLTVIIDDVEVGEIPVADILP